MLYVRTHREVVRGPEDRVQEVIGYPGQRLGVVVRHIGDVGRGEVAYARSEVPLE
jgi:hypothetical protein